MASYIRSTKIASSAKLVITALVCGNSSNPRKVAPPLKSTNTKFKASGLWVAASATTRVRSNSDFPEPVAPTHNPCGPAPPWADSFRSMTKLRPVSSCPIGTLSRFFPRGCHSRVSVSGVKSLTPNSSNNPALPLVVWLSGRK